LKVFITRSRIPVRVFLFSGFAFVVVVLASCQFMPAEEKLGRDINTVLAAHDKELMAKPGVVGVYVGLLEDGKTPCLKIMLARADPQLEKSLPRMLEGYRVVTEVTGPMRPMR
jgi:hypothetical protein